MMTTSSDPAIDVLLRRFVSTYYRCCIAPQRMHPNSDVMPTHHNKDEEFAVRLLKSKVVGANFLDWNPEFVSSIVPQLFFSLSSDFSASLKSAVEHHFFLDITFY